MFLSRRPLRSQYADISGARPSAPPPTCQNQTLIVSKRVPNASPNPHTAKRSPTRVSHLHEPNSTQNCATIYSSIRHCPTHPQADHNFSSRNQTGPAECSEQRQPERRTYTVHNASRKTRAEEENRHHVSCALALDVKENRSSSRKVTTPVTGDHVAP